MTTTQAIRLSNPADLVALLPSRLGFTPTESIVLVSLRPRSGQVGLLLRIDLTQLVGRDAPSAAARLTRVLLNDDAGAILVALYPSPRFGQLKLNHAIQPLLSQFRQAELPYSVWIASDDDIKRFEVASARPVNDPTPVKDPRPGKQSPTRLKGVATPPPLGLPKALAIDKRSARRATRRALDARLHMGSADCGPWRLAIVNLFLDGMAAHQTGAIQSEPARLQPTELGRLAALLADPVGRDSIIVAAIGASPDLARQMAAGDWHMAGNLPAEVHQLLNPMTAPPAPADQVAAAEAVLRGVVAHASAGYHPAACDLLAWLAWWKGDALLAHEYLAVAETGSNEPPLGDLVRAGLAAGLMPPSRVQPLAPVC